MIERSELRDSDVVRTATGWLVVSSDAVVAAFANEEDAREFVSGLRLRASGADLAAGAAVGRKPASGLPYVTAGRSSAGRAFDASLDPRSLEGSSVQGRGVTR
jgi:hypothetical protein